MRLVGERRRSRPLQKRDPRGASSSEWSNQIQSSTLSRTVSGMLSSLSITSAVKPPAMSVIT